MATLYFRFAFPGLRLPAGRGRERRGRDVYRRALRYCWVDAYY